MNLARSDFFLARAGAKLDRGGKSAGSVMEWCLDDIDVPQDPGVVPTREQTDRLIHMYRTTWTPGNATERTIDGMLGWAFRRLDLNLAEYTWETLTNALDTEHRRLMKLAGFASVTGADTIPLAEIHAVHQAIRESSTHLARLRVNAVSQDSSMWQTLPLALRNGPELDKDKENMFNYDESTLRPFQLVFMYLRPILEACKYRRSEGKFYTRIMVGGQETLAFEEALSIVTFVSNHTAHYANFKMFKTITSVPHARDQLVRHLTNEPLLEAPNLEPQLHLRSYAGDEYGRGAGVYDSADVFFPYAMREHWDIIAKRATETRSCFASWNHIAERKWRGPRDPEQYEIKAPTDNEVCIVHLESCFPGNVFSEIVDRMSVQKHLRWREAHQYECTGRNLDCPQLAQLIAGKLSNHRKPHFARDWTVTDSRGSKGLVSDNAELREVLQEAFDTGKPLRLTEEQIRRFQILAPATCVLLEGDRYAMPAPKTAAKPRVNLTEDEWDDLNLVPPPAETPGAPAETVPRELDYVVLGSGDTARYFIQDTGMTWMDCEAPELDQIFKCQKFTDYDRFWIYALMGRLFFKVRELDEFEMTLFFEGIGGSGKSTILRALMGFWPSHLRGTLSSNMQPQFGMGSLAHAVVCFCTEVSETLNLPQEEWQDATGGAELSMAVKGKEPIKKHWESQFVWAGNNFPKIWKNGQLQVTRRLAGVCLNESVKPRDSSIPKKIDKGRGSLQRRCILAYYAWLRINGNIDPMSREDNMPPAFAEYYRRGKRESNPLADFLSDDKYTKLDPQGEILFDDLRELYNAYRTDNNLGKAVKWTEDAYKSIFSDLGLVVITHPVYTVRGVEQSNVRVIHGVQSNRLPPRGGEWGAITTV